jgi:hypothetical protein
MLCNIIFTPNGVAGLRLRMFPCNDIKNLRSMVTALGQARMQETCLVSDQQTQSYSSQQQYHRYNRLFYRGL